METCVEWKQDASLFPASGLIQNERSHLFILLLILSKTIFAVTAVSNL